MWFRKSSAMASCFVVSLIWVGGCSKSPANKKAQTKRCQATCYASISECKGLKEMIAEQKELVRAAFANPQNKQLRIKQRMHKAAFFDKHQECDDATKKCLGECAEKYK